MEYTCTKRISIDFKNNQMYIDHEKAFKRILETNINSI